MSFIKAVYILAVALFIGLFVGLGIAAFYPEPSRPDFPQEPRPANLPPEKLSPNPSYYESAEYRQFQEETNKRLEAYDRARKIHERNTFFIASLGGIIFMLAGLFLAPRMDVIRSGFLLGGAAATVYGISRYWGDISDQWRFGVVTVVLGLLIYLGYKKLIEKVSAAGS